MSVANAQNMIGALERSNGKIVMFADGFVDEVWEIINSRTSLSQFTLYQQMNQFAARIANSGTGGVGLELIQKRRAFGGFTANIGYASARLGVDAALVGIYGKEALDPVFEEVGELCRVYSLDDPAVTHVFEFDDGKILMSHMEAVLDISWQRIVDTLGLETIVSLLTEADMIGVGYWSLLPAFDEIMDGVCAHIPEDGKTRRFFFDFADFRKKDQASLEHTLEKLRAFNGTYPMILSVNEHEAATLFAMYNETLDDTGRSIQEKTETVRQKIGLDEFVIHTPHYAVAAASNEAPAYAESVFCEKPVRTAGAGDTFNGGYMAASLAGLGIAERLHVANAAVGCFLRTGIFPDRENLTV
ncbi:MAG: PfkB family carbohydrate kinase [Oscillospiraceae bacterium]|nr:PfkB family carbohydrate kinase [Oscillospiraceae bacterium]